MLSYPACSYQAFLCFILLIEHLFWVFGLLLHYFPYCPLVFLCFPSFLVLNVFTGLPSVLNTTPPSPTTFLFVATGPKCKGGTHKEKKGRTLFTGNKI